MAAPDDPTAVSAPGSANTPDDPTAASAPDAANAPDDPTVADTPEAANASEHPGPGVAPGTVPEGSPIGRRVFLGVAGVGLSSLWWGDNLLNLASETTKALPKSVRASVPFGEGWRIYAVNPPYPVFKPASWKLRIEGLVEEPMDLTYEQLLALPRAKQTSDFHCVTGWSVSDVRWEGVRIHDLLAAAKPLATATGIEFWSAEEPYVDTLTMNQALLPDVMIAHQMDDVPITQEHGAPTRLVMPKMYGYKGVKWVSRLVLTDKIEPGYWEQRGYDTDAWVGNSNGL